METISLRTIRKGRELTTATWLHLPLEVSTIAPELSVKEKKKKNTQRKSSQLSTSTTQRHSARIRVKLNEKVLFC